MAGDIPQEHCGTSTAIDRRLGPELWRILHLACDHRSRLWFRAAVDVAGVADYALYYDDPYHGGWTTSRIGTPEEHPEVYDEGGSPMSHRRPDSAASL